MRVEWMALCREVFEDDAGTDVLGLGQTGVVVSDPPQDQVLEVAYCLLVPPTEADQSAVLTIRGEVHRPDGSWAGSGFETVAIVPGVPMPDDYERRSVRRLQVAFTASDPGTYRVSVGIGDQERVSVPYRVQHAH